MSCYISSKENRYYTALEQSFGYVPAVTEKNRLPGVKLDASHVLEKVVRRDKTGGRTFVGLPDGLRSETRFELTTYLTSWSAADAEPCYGPLLRAALGGSPLVYGGGTIDALTGAQLRFVAPHGLTSGQGISCGGEIRFAMALIDDYEIVLNAPLTGDQAAGWPVDRTMTYWPAATLPSVSLLDYWSPAGAVQRIVAGAAVDQMKVEINGDFHELVFAGMGKDLIDSASFVSQQGGLTSFPVEPADAGYDYAVVPGNLGQAWLGTAPDQFFTLTKATVTVDNGLDMRSKEFGFTTPRCVVAGPRSVTADFNLFEMDDAATKALYQAARQRSPVSAMFQLGQQASQLCGVYLKSFVPEVPEFNDDQAQLEWRFQGSRAQGILDDEIAIAFG